MKLKNEMSDWLAGDEGALNGHSASLLAALLTSKLLGCVEGACCLFCLSGGKQLVTS